MYRSAWKRLRKAMKAYKLENAKELISLKSSLRKIGIGPKTWSPYTPTSNEVAKRINWTVLNKMRFWLKQVEWVRRFGGEAIYHAVYLSNGTVTPTLGGMTPQEELLETLSDNFKIIFFCCGINAYRAHASRTFKPEECSEMCYDFVLGTDDIAYTFPVNRK